MQITLKNGDVLTVTPSTPQVIGQTITIDAQGKQSSSDTTGNTDDYSITATVNGVTTTTDLGHYNNFAISDQGYLYLDQKALSPLHVITVNNQTNISTNSDPEEFIYIYDYFNHQFYNGSNAPLAESTVQHFYITGTTLGTDHSGKATWSDFDAIYYQFDNNSSPEVTNNKLGTNTYNFDYQWHQINLTPRLFSPGKDNVDFNNPSQYSAIRDGAVLYSTDGGNDAVTLPNTANYDLARG